MSQAGTLEDLLGALDQLDAFRNRVFRAKTPADLSAAQAGLARITHSIEQRYPDFDRDLAAEYRRAFAESGGTGNPPTNFTAKSTRSRGKAQKGFQKATAGIRKWGDEYGRDRQIIKAQQAYQQQIKLLQRSGGDPRKIADMKNALQKLPNTSGATDDPSIVYHRKTPSGRITNVHMKADDYMRMATNAAYATQRNLGVAAAATQKSGYVVVHDGPECGQNGHHNGPAVNGEVWDTDTALRYPISHPYCTRYFTVSDGPPGSKRSKDQLRKLGLAPQRRSALNSLEKIASAAAAAGVVASTTSAVLTNPFIKRAIREIIADSEINLNPVAQRLLNRLVTYGKNEETAFRQYGETVGASTQEQFNRIIANSFDEDLANEQFLSAASTDRGFISLPQARVLGLPKNASKGEILERLDDYGDWIINREAMAKSAIDRLDDTRHFSQAFEELHRTAALSFHLQPAQGLNLDRNWYRVLQRLKETYDADPEKADRELIRLTASVFDPTPWLRVPLTDDVRFTLGLTSRGRQNLAVKLYDIMRKSRALSTTEARWAEQLGMDLAQFTQPESITVQDIVRALQPRITYQPGGMFSSTLSLTNGKLQPIIRLYPRGSYARLISLETKLRSGAIEEFIAAMRKSDLPLAQRWVEGLSKVAHEDLITSINLFRNSPLQLSLRMIGQYPDSFAIRALPDNNFLRYSYRFTLDARGRSALEGEVRKLIDQGKDVDQVLHDLALVDEKSVRAAFRKEQAAIARQNIQDWMEGVTVLPNFGGGFTLNGMSVSQREAIIKLKLLGNNLLTIGKRTRYGYDQLLELWAEVKNTITDIGISLKDQRLLHVRSFKEATDLLGDALRTKASKVDIIRGEGVKEVDLDFASDVIKHPGVDEGLKDDLALFRQAWVKEFSESTLPVVRISTTITTPLASEPGVILIREDAARDWSILRDLRRKAVRIGHFPRDTEASVGNLIHEGAHSILLRMSNTAIRNIMQHALDSQGWPINATKVARSELPFMRAWFTKPQVQKRIARSLSGYATTSIDEFLSEALTEYFTSNNPRPIAKAVGDQFLLFLGRS